MSQIIIDEFFSKYLLQICPLLNPLIDHAESFIKFRSDVVIKNISNNYENSDDMTEFYFHILPDPLNFSFETIEKVISHLLLTNRFIKNDLLNTDIVLDLYYKKLTECIFPALVVKIYFIGKAVDLNFVSNIQQKLDEVNKFSSTDTGWWRKRKTRELYDLLSERKTEPFDFFELKSYFLKKAFTYSSMFNFNQLNYYVPHIISVSNLNKDETISLFKDIRVIEWDSNETIEDIDNLGSMDQSYDECPF